MNTPLKMDEDIFTEMMCLFEEICTQDFANCRRKYEKIYAGEASPEKCLRLLDVIIRIGEEAKVMRDKI